MSNQMNDEKWMNDLRNKEENFIPELPEGLWDNIKESLPTKKSHMVFPLWLRYASIAACVVFLLGISGYLLQHSSVTSEIPVVSENKVQHYLKDIPSTAKPLLPKTVRYDSFIAMKKPFIQSDSTLIVVDTIQKIQKAQKAPRNTETICKNEEKESNSTQENSNHNKYKYKKCDTWIANSSTTNNKGHNVSVSIYAGNIMSKNSSNALDYGPCLSTVPSDGDLIDKPMGEDPFNDIFVLNQDRNPETKTKYSLPIRIGVSIEKPLNDCWAIESGIVYTILSSNIKSGTEENYYDTNQKLHYLGVPLKLNCRIWKNNHLGIYISGGGMIEKCIYGKNSSKFTIGGHQSGSKCQNINEKELQFSTSLSAGIESNLSKNISIFLEPSLNYHFDNHSEINNSYKDKPLNLDFMIGLRFNINK